jgi:hypothetical protein
MATGSIPHNRRCAMCGQYVQTTDREAMLEADRWEWSESMIDEARAANLHSCTDQDPHGARESERLIEAGIIRPELRWLLQAELERRQAAQAATIPAYRLLPAPRTTTIIIIATVVGGAWMTVAYCWPEEAATRGAAGRARVRLPVAGIGRSPPPVRARLPSNSRFHAGGARPRSPPTTPSSDHARTRVTSRPTVPL